MLNTALTHREKFCNLLAEYQSSQGYELNGDIPQQGTIAFSGNWDGIAFELLHSTFKSSQNMLVRCRLGALPQQDREQAVKLLFKFQRIVTPEAMAVVSLDPNSGEACVTQAVSLDKASKAGLLEVMENLREWAIDWRSSRFLHEDGQLL